MCKQRQNKYDAVIVGAGMIGLSTAKAMLDLNLDVAIVEKKPPDLSWDKSIIAKRVSAINRRSEFFLKTIGVWDNILNNIDNGVAYDKMEIWENDILDRLEFNAIDVGETELGYIIENRILIKELWELIFSQNIQPYYSHISDISGDPGDWTITLSSGELIRCELIIGCDGGNSWVRDFFSFDTSIKPYNHHALIATVHVDGCNESTAFQRFLKTGPLAFLPTAKPHIYSIVWSISGDRYKELINLTDSDFNCELNKIMSDRLGKCQIISSKLSFPLFERHSKSYYKNGVVLVGDAAHTIHPLAGQGVNLGFNDVKFLIKALSKAKDSDRSLWHYSTLANYERRVRLFNSSMVLSMKAIKEVFSNENDYIMKGRAVGIKLLNKFTLGKSILIKIAMGK